MRRFQPLKGLEMSKSHYSGVAGIKLEFALPGNIGKPGRSQGHFGHHPERDG